MRYGEKSVDNLAKVCSSEFKLSGIMYIVRNIVRSRFNSRRLFLCKNMVYADFLTSAARSSLKLGGEAIPPATAVQGVGYAR